MIYTPYIWPPLVAAAILMGIAVYVRRHRAMPAARSSLVLMSLASLWSLIFALNVCTVTYWPKILWQRLQILPAMFTSVLSLSLALEYLGREEWLTRRRLASLLVVPTLAVLLELTGHDSYDTARSAQGHSALDLSRRKRGARLKDE